MKYIKKYESYNLADIENIDKIKNKKYLTILDFYTCLIDKNNLTLTLNIPIDIYYINNYPNSYFENKEKKGYNHFCKISSMWMSLDNQHFDTYKESPYFIVKLLGENEFYENFIIRNHKSNELIIDAIYDYAMKNSEIMLSRKYNL
jgi:hypothetical protein